MLFRSAARLTRISHAKALGVSSAILHLDGGLESLLLLGDAVLSLGTHDAATPLLPGLFSLLQVTILDSGDELRELVLVLGANLGDSKNSGGLCEVSSRLGW